MGVCCTSVVAAATFHTRARRSRALSQVTKKRPNASSGLIAVAGSSNQQQQQYQISGPAPSQQPHRLFRHRWRRILRFSAVAPNQPAVFRRKLIPEDINFGRDFYQLPQPLPSPDRYYFSSKPSWCFSSFPGVFQPHSEMFTATSTNSTAEYGVTMDSPLFAQRHSPAEERLKRRLRFFFLNPVQKWAATRRFPFKLFTQIIKIIFVTVQLCLFASFRDSHVFYARNTEVVFSHLFLQEWDVTREAPPYPPAAGPLAVYSKKQFHEYLDFAIENYINLETSSMGAYFHLKNSKGSWITYCQTDYIRSQFEPNSNEFKFDSNTNQECVEIPIDADVSAFKSEDFLREKNITVSGLSLVEATLMFSIKAIHFKPNGPLNGPDCYSFDLGLVFNNQGEDGQLLVSLSTLAKHLDCHGKVNPPVSDGPSKSFRSTVNILVILICGFSFFLCARAVIKAQLLKWETSDFFQRHFNRRMSKHDRLEFLNLWYVLIIIDDVLLVGGSIIKELMENQHIDSDMWDVCSVLLGTGNLFVWFGVLRYLGFFRTYNMLIVTLKKAFPSVLRFLLCAMLIYAGFTFCGWLIFGPYHFKFQTISSTSECLFSLVNGDDMFATFAGMSERSALVWWFSRLYLYSFISLFIYVVLSLFIALIMDTYETIKMYYTDGFPKSDLRQFIANDDCVDTIPVYESQSCFPQLWSLLTRRRPGYEVIDDGRKDEEAEERQPILA
ncbi:mucolipin-3-like [Daphnia pulicaria]|uniref:mucolipin-3-like n=1 Tax=Daphnia pulicaria TaxID=35523 RepID=UPI001EEC5746|nr:mucolipin-3-like [Daphnia pulicaria]